MKYLIILAYSMTISLTVNAQVVNYCHDDTTNQQWRELMKENGHYPEWQEMRQLRNQLCHDIDNGGLTLDEATNQFEIKRKRVVGEFK